MAMERVQDQKTVLQHSHGVLQYLKKETFFFK